jgi:glycosyltransferase involved in cell wall biosynthesis
MKILHIAALLSQSDIYGGGVTFPESVAREHAAMGHDVTLWGCWIGDGPRYSDVQKRKLRLVRERPIMWRPFHRSNPLFLRLPFHMLANRYDIVHFHQWQVIQYLWLIPLAWLLQSRVIVTDLGGGGWRKQPKWLMRFVHCFACMSSFSASFFPRHKGRVVGGGFDPDLFRGQARGDPERPTILYVGRLMPHKGVHLLIRAVDLLRREGLGVSLRIVGGEWATQYRDALDEFADKVGLRKHIHFCGPRFGSDLVQEYLSASCLVLPSTHHPGDGRYIEKPELFGIVLVEAMAVGLPVVASTIHGPDDVVRNGQTGYRFIEGNPDDLARAIRCALRNDTTTLARELAHRECTWRRVAERCLV